MKRTKSIRKKRLNYAERRKLKQSEVIRERLDQLGKSKEWLVDELKRRFKVNKSTGRNIIKGDYLVSVQDYVLYLSALLKVHYRYFFDE